MPTEPFHVSEAELAETRARLKRQAEANRPRYRAQDAALSALTKEEYRALLEAVLAGHIADAAKAADPADPEEAELLRYEINGLCVALRLLGGYEVEQPHKEAERVVFDLDWAREVAPVSFNWRGFLGYAAERRAGVARQFPLSPERTPFFSPADYLTAAVTRLGAAADTQDFNVGEVTLRFDEDAWAVRLKVELRISAELLDHTPAPGGAIGAPRG